MKTGQAEINRMVEDFRQHCRQRGIKVTHQRTEVFRELASSSEHPDAETVYGRVRRRIPSISLDTVYRILNWLVDQELVRPVGAGTGAARYDADLRKHHHFVCVRCGSVQDFSSQALDELPLPRTVDRLGQIQSSHVQVLGRCTACDGSSG